MSVLVRIQQSDQVLIGTGIGQIRYLNRATMRFESFDSEATSPLFASCMGWCKGGARGYYRPHCYAYIVA